MEDNKESKGRQNIEQFNVLQKDAPQFISAAKMINL